MSRNVFSGIYYIINFSYQLAAQRDTFVNLNILVLNGQIIIKRSLIIIKIPKAFNKNMLYRHI